MITASAAPATQELPLPASVTTRNQRLASVSAAYSRAIGAIDTLSAALTRHEEEMFAAPLQGTEGDYLFARLRGHRFKLSEARECEGCQDSIESARSILGDQELKRRASQMRAAENDRVALLTQCMNSIVTIRGPLRALLKTCQSSETVQQEPHDSLTPYIDEFKDCLKQPRALKRGDGSLVELAWTMSIPDQKKLPVLKQLLAEAQTRTVSFVEQMNARDIQFAQEQSRRSAASPVPELSTATAPSVSTPAPLPEKTLETSDLAASPDSSTNSVPSGSADAGTATAAPQPEAQAETVHPAEAKLTGQGVALPEVPSPETATAEQEAPDPKLAEQESVFLALETYILDETRRREVAETLTRRAFNYRMTALETAFPCLDGVRDSNLLDIQAVLDHNPRILTIEPEEFEAYVRQAAQVAALRRQLPQLGGEFCNPQLNPQNFVGQAALNALAIKLDDRVEYQKIKTGLAALEYDPEAAFAIARYGFYYASVLHIGHRLVPRAAMIRENTEHYLGKASWDRLGLETTFKHLQQDRMIVTRLPNGTTGFALNSNGVGRDGPAHQILVDLVHWVIKHHRSPREQFE